LQSIKLACPKTQTPFGEMFYPGLIVGVLLDSGKYQTFEFILDSGADCTVAPHYLAEMTGNHLTITPDAYMTGIAGVEMPCHKGKLSLKIRDLKFDVRCLFTESDNTLFLLGRLDFFSSFKILFDGSQCNIILTRQ